MKILITYASNSGSTYFTSLIIKDELERAKFQVDVKKAVDTTPLDFNAYEYVLIGSPSWLVNGEEASPHEDILDLLERIKNENFENKKFAIFGCGDSSYSHFCGAVDYISNYVKEKNGMQLVMPLKVNGFFFNQEENEQLIKNWANRLINKLNPTKHFTKF